MYQPSNPRCPVCEFCPTVEDKYCGVCQQVTPVLPPPPEPVELKQCPVRDSDLLVLAGAAGQLELAGRIYLANRVRALRDELKAYFSL